MNQIERLEVENDNLLEEIKRLREDNRKANEDFRKVVKQRDEMWDKVDSIQRKLVEVTKDRPIDKTFLPDMSETPEEVHNPENVTEWGADKGYRLLFKSEVSGGDWWDYPDIPEVGVWVDEKWEQGGCAACNETTYRTKLTPEQLAQARKAVK